MLATGSTLLKCLWLDAQPVKAQYNGLLTDTHVGTTGVPREHVVISTAYYNAEWINCGDCLKCTFLCNSPNYQQPFTMSG